ncbi:MAG: sigma-70 family RNA polymerase sigma factor, partial [Caldilineaceae bacterium]
MTDSSSIDLCVQVVRALSEAETWLLSAKGIKHFAESVFAFATQIPGSMESVDSLHKIAQERYWNFYTRCKRVAETIDQAEGWQLTAGEIEKLVTVVLPYALASPACLDNDSAIATIIINYDAEGPMVQAMLTIGSSAGEKLWVEWRAHMLNVAYSKGLATDDAEELVQGVYLNAQKGLRQFCHQSKLQTYFFKIFTNHYREWLRNKRRQREGESPPPDSSTDLPELPDKAVNLENDIIHHTHLVEIADYVKQEIIKLTSTEDFDLLYLYYVEKNYVDPQSKKVVKWT